MLEQLVVGSSRPVVVPAVQFAFEESQKYKEGKFILEKVSLAGTLCE